MQIRTLSGTRIEQGAIEIFALSVSSYYFIFWILGYLVSSYVVTVATLGIWIPDTLWIKFFLSCGLISYALNGFIYFFVIRAAESMGIRHIYCLPIAILSMSLPVFIAAGDEFYNAGLEFILLSILYIAVMSEILAEIFMRFFFEKSVKAGLDLFKKAMLRASLGLAQKKAAADDTSTGPLSFQVAGTSYPLAGLRYIVAQRQYMQIVWEGRTQLVRARISDITAQLPPQWGIHIHRSYWIAKEAIAKISKQNGKTIILTTDGTSLPVARHRREDLEIWMKKNGLVFSS